MSATEPPREKRPVTLSRIAIVDDEPAIAEILAMALADAGFDAEIFTSADALVEAVGRGAHGIVLIDLMMPRCDGVQLIQRLGRLPRPPRVGLVSGAPGGTRRCVSRLAREAGVEVFADFAKPVDIAALVGRLAELSGHGDGEREGGIIDAIARGEVELFYQPVFRARAGSGARLAALEALLRWRHPSRGLLLPADFLPAVQSREDWERLTLAVAGMAAAQMRDWAAVGFEPRVAINVPPALVARPDFPDLLDAVLEEHAVPRDRLVIEIVEGADTGRREAAAGLTRLQLRGYRLSIDDFVTGHSSLERLYDVPFGQLKVDAGFVTRAHRDPDAHRIVASSVALARELGLEVCAEGIEEVEGLRAMVDLGVDYLQGFGLCRPLPAAMIEAQFNGS